MHFTVTDGVGTVQLDRPDKLNALTFEVYGQLRDLFRTVHLSGDVRAVVLRGSGRAFCSGGDVHEIIGATLSMEPRELLAFTRMTGDVIRAMRECPVPVIAAVHGMAAGAGAVLALASDFRVCSEQARFAFLFTKVGLSGADMGAAYLLPRLVGMGHATRLLMFGDTVTADEAFRIGLASYLVSPPDDFDSTVDDLARRLADGPAEAYAQTKALLAREQDMSLSSAVELEAQTQALLMKGADYAEFHAAFTGKRAPRWQGRLALFTASQLAHHVQGVADVAADVRHRVEDVPDSTVAVDHIGDPARYHGQRGRHAVELAHLAARVGEQRERQLVLASEPGVLVHRVRAHADDRRPGIDERLIAVPEGARLRRAAAGVVLRIEVQNDNM
jgi:enoyl-CoA hydratase/carnithine racemase